MNILNFQPESQHKSPVVLRLQLDYTPEQISAAAKDYNNPRTTPLTATLDRQFLYLDSGDTITEVAWDGRDKGRPKPQLQFIPYGLVNTDATGYRFVTFATATAEFKPTAPMVHINPDAQKFALDPIGITTNIPIVLYMDTAERFAFVLFYGDPGNVTALPSSQLPPQCPKIELPYFSPMKLTAVSDLPIDWGTEPNPHN